MNIIANVCEHQCLRAPCSCSACFITICSWFYLFPFFNDAFTKLFCLCKVYKTSLNWKMCSNFATFKKAAQVFGQRKNVDSCQCSCSKFWTKTFSIFRQHIGMNFMICEKEGFTVCFCFFFKNHFSGRWTTFDVEKIIICLFFFCKTTLFF